MGDNRKFWEEQGEAWKPLGAKDKKKVKKEPNLEEGATEVEAEVALRSLAELGFIYPRDDGPRGDDGWSADGRAPRWWGVISTASDDNLHLDELLDELSTI